MGLTADRIVVEGGKPLVGRVEVRGAKNLVTKAMVAALLGDSPSLLQRRSRDQRRPRRHPDARRLRRLGHQPRRGRAAARPEQRLKAHFAQIDALAGSSRIPILFCGPLLHRLGEALIPDLGGCRIGDRPIDFHMDALRAFGAVVDKSYEGIRITAPNGLHGANIDLPYPSVGATEQVLLTAVRAKGVTELKNAAIEPEIMDLIAILQKMGAIITVEPNRTIFIEGVETLERLHAPRDLRPQRGRQLGLRGARDRRRHLRRRREAAGAHDVPQRLPQGGRRVRRAGGRHPLLPRRTAQAGRRRDGCAPRLHDGLAAAAHRRAHPGGRRLDRARDRVREPLRIHRRAQRDGRRHRRARARLRLGRAGACRSVPLEQVAVITGPTQAARGRCRRARPARRIQLPDRGARGRGTSTVTNIGIISRGYEHFVEKLEALGADFTLEG